MSINKDHLDNHDLDIFDDDFEVIYEGELPDIPMPEDDNFQDVLSNLSDLDRTKNIDYLEENYTTSFDWMKKQRENMKKLPRRKNEKKCRTFLSLWQKLLRRRKSRFKGDLQNNKLTSARRYFNFNRSDHCRPRLSLLEELCTLRLTRPSHRPAQLCSWRLFCCSFVPASC